MSLLGVLIGNSGAKKAAKYQLRGAQEQIANANANRDFQYGLNAPTIDAGNAATSLYSGFLGVGGDPAASANALDTFRGSTGYNDLLQTGLNAVNSNAYARGSGNSGATRLALMRQGQSIASRSAQGYLGNLGTLMSAGNTARSLAAGIGNNTVNAVNQATQTGSDAQSNSALIQSGNWVKFLSQLESLAAGGAGGFASTGSSFGGFGA